jgi:hypothetical protein
VEPTALIEAADKLGVIAGMVLLAYALWKKALVPGWVYDQCEVENKELKALLNAHASRTEARVATLEQERDKRYGNPA